MRPGRQVAAGVTTAPGEPTAAKRTGRMRVRAIQMGFYDHLRRRIGDVFTIDASLFSKRWMVEVDAKTPESITTGPQELRRLHDETMSDRASGVMPGLNPDDVSEDLPTGTANPLGASE